MGPENKFPMKLSCAPQNSCHLTLQMFHRETSALKSECLALARGSGQREVLVSTGLAAEPVWPLGEAGAGLPVHAPLWLAHLLSAFPVHVGPPPSPSLPCACRAWLCPVLALMVPSPSLFKGTEGWGKDFHVATTASF